MAMAPIVKVVLGSIAFAIFWVLAVFPAVPFLPVGRTAGSLLGAMLMVIFHVISPDQAYDANDLPILGLLFGTMVVSVYLERADMFKYLGRVLSWKSMGGKDLLCRTCLISAISSALFTNDTSCVVLTEFVLKIARQNNLPPQPFLLALASSANIGSSATPIGNPQNLVTAVTSKITFREFLVGILPAMLIGVVMNAVLLLCFFWRMLSIEKDEEATLNDAIAEDNVTSHSDVASFESASEKERRIERRKQLLWKTSVSLRTIGMLISFLMGLNMSWTAITAALALVVLDFKDAQPCLEKVSYSLLIFFCGMFITIDGFNKTGIPKTVWDAMEPYARIDHAGGIALLALVILVLSNIASNAPTGIFITAELFLFVVHPCVFLLSLSWCSAAKVHFGGTNVSYSLLIFFCGMFITIDGFNKTGIPKTVWNAMEPYARIDHAGGIALLALVILVVSNIASNAPTVLLLGVQVAASAAAISAADEKKAWLILAWVSTVAGNLSLLGSAANLIVCEQARRAQSLSYTLSFWSPFYSHCHCNRAATHQGLMCYKSREPCSGKINYKQRKNSAIKLVTAKLEE